MSKVLDHSQAFEPGNSLWMISYVPSSPWYQRLNWLTNFKLTTNELHRRPEINPWLLKILEACEIAPPQIPLAEPLLVPVAQWLPADWLMTIPFDEKNPQDFIEKIKKIWAQFQYPSLRVFVPESLDLQQWQTLWKENSKSSNITLVFEKADSKKASSSQ